MNLNNLPTGWEAKALKDGRIFFINDDLKFTSWLHPVTGSPIKTGNFKSKNLPHGWEYNYTKAGHKYYINHNRCKNLKLPPKHSNHTSETRTMSPKTDGNYYINMASIYMGNMARHRRILSDCANVSAAQKSVDFNIESYENSPMYPFEETYSSIRDPAHTDYVSTDDAKTTSFTFKENGEASRENSSSSGCSSLIPHQQDQKSCHFQDSPNLSSHLQRKQKHLRQNTSCPNIIEEDIDGDDVHIDNGKNCNFLIHHINDFALHQHVGFHDEKNEATFSIPTIQSSSQIKNNFLEEEHSDNNNPSSSPKEAFVNTGKKLISNTLMKFLRGSHMCAAPPSLTSNQQNRSSKKRGSTTTATKKAISNPVTPQDTATDTEGGTKTNIIKCKANGEIPNQKQIPMNGSANPIPNGHLPYEYLNISTAPRILRENWLFFLEKVPIIHWVKKWVILDEVSLLIFPTRPINTTLNKSITPNGLHDISYIDESNIPKLLSFINNTSEYDDEGGQDNAMRTFSLKIPAPLGNLQNVIGNYTPPFQEPNDTTIKNNSSPHEKANQGKDYKTSVEQNGAQNSTLMYSFALEIETTTTMVTTLNPDVVKNCNGQQMKNPPVPLCNSTPNAKNIHNNIDQNQKSMRRKRKKLEYLTMATMNGAERDEWVKTFSWIISHHRTLALKARQKQTFAKNLTQPTLNYNGQQSNNKASVNGLHSTNNTNNVNNNNPIHNVSPIEPSPRFRERCKTEISIKRNSVLQSQQQNNNIDDCNQNTTDYLTLKRENSRQRDLQSSPLKEDLILILIRNRRELSKLKQELSDIVQAQSSLQYTNANTLSSQNTSSHTLQNELKCLSENKQTIRQKIQKYEAVISTLEGLLKQTDTYSNNKKENTTFVSTLNNTTNISYKYPQYNHQYHLSDISPHTNQSNQNGRQQTLHNDLCNKANSSDQTCQMSLPNYREQILMLDKLAMDYQKLIDDVTSLTIRTYPQFLARYNCIGEEIKENLQILSKIGGNNENSQTFDHNMLARRERIAHIQDKLEMLKTKAHKFYNQREEMLLNTSSAENTAAPQRSVLHNLATRTTFKNGKDENCANYYTNNMDRVEHINNNLHQNNNLNNRFDKNNYLHYSQNVRNGIYESSERHENLKEFNKPNGHNTATNETNLNSQNYEFDQKMSTTYYESQINHNSKNNFILADKNVTFDRNGINYGNNSESPVTLQRIRMGHHGIKQNFDHLPSTLRRSLKNRTPQEVSFESDCHIPRVLRRAHNANEYEQKRKNRSQSVPPPDTVEEMLYERKSPPDASNNRPNAQSSDHAKIQNERNRKSSFTVNKGSMYNATFQPYSAQPTLSNPQSYPMYISYQNNQTTTTMESTHNNHKNAKCSESKLTPPQTYYHANCDKNLPHQFYSNEGRRPSCSKVSEFIEHTVDRNGQIDSSRHQTNVYYMRAYGRCSPSTLISPKSPKQEREERKCSINGRNFLTNYPQLHQLNANSPMVETYKDLNVLSIKETPIEQISAYPPNNYYQAQQTQSSTPGNHTKTVILVEPKCKTAGGKGANPKIFTKESSPCSLANSVYSAEIGLETIDQELSRPQKINIPERLRDEELVLCELMANQANLTPANVQAGFDSLTQTQINQYILAQKNYATSCGLDSPKQHSTSASLSLDSSTPPLANKTHHHHSARNNESVFAPLKVQIPPPPPLLHTNDNKFLRTIQNSNKNNDQRSLTTTDYNNNNIEAYRGDKILSPLYKDEKLNHTNHVSPEEKETKERVKAAIKKEYLKNLLSNYGSHDLSPQIAHGRTTSSPYIRSSLSSSTNDSPNVNHQRHETDFPCDETNMNNSYHKTYHMNGGDKTSPNTNSNYQSNDFTGERAFSHNGHSNSWLEEERCRREKLLNLNELLAKEVAAKTRKMMLNNALSRDMANETSLSSPTNQSGPKKFENYIPFTTTVKEEDQNNGPRTDIEQFLHYNFSESNGF